MTDAHDSLEPDIGFVLNIECRLIVEQLRLFWVRPLRDDMALEEAVQSHVVFSAEEKSAGGVTIALFLELFGNNVFISDHMPITDVSTLWLLLPKQT